MQKILLPIDRGQYCTKAFKMAKEMAENLGAEILILHVIEIAPHFYEAAKKTGLMPTRKYLEEESEDLLEKAKEFFKDSTAIVDIKTSWGKATENILSISEEEKCDMIIMCTHGMSAPLRFLLGSVTNIVVHHAKVPVLVVR